MSTIVITGASSGLGAEMARQFADLGHDLGLCARRTDRLETLRSDILASHPDRRVVLRELDVLDDEAVFETFGWFREELGELDRVVVNAGIGKGAPLGTGRYDANRRTVMTNLVAGLAQIEAAMEIFRAQEHGHLVVISSVAAVRGMPKAQTTYAATKAGLAHLAEGLQVELAGTGIDVSIVYPGFIASEMTDALSTPMTTGTVKGVRSIVAAVEKRKDHAFVPPLPWLPMSVVMRHAPAALYRRVV